MSTSDPAAAASAAAAAPADARPAGAAVSPGSPEAPGLGPLPERIAEALLAHPAVAALSGGPFGTLATYLPGRRLPGIVLGDAGEPDRIGVVLRFGAPVGATAAELRRIVAAASGNRRVDVTVTDLEFPE
ncbi:hypothetical protein [Actinomycetospora straminea]|uniref:Asp23/Gls24 family envelope stress response protein n=1 Tax=Actinomycetospora straminea TaxID=663607 RepID=A0ABP9E4F5_9PSEU|nr:hypothetical protein [Actinomycetospora straminea]MDD7934110.1 hypothetical protein [Actinomycetospora straminea]